MTDNLNYDLSACILVTVDGDITEGHIQFREIWGTFPNGDLLVHEADGTGKRIDKDALNVTDGHNVHLSGVWTPGDGALWLTVREIVDQIAIPDTYTHCVVFDGGYKMRD